MEATAQALLDLSKPLDVALLEDVVAATYDPHNPNQAAANRILMAMKEIPEMWTRADAILEQATTPQARFFGLQILDDAIQAFGGAGVSGDTPLASAWASMRTLRFADGPDEVHNRAIARSEFGKYGAFKADRPSSGDMAVTR